jgi:uncharacterized phage protein (TIGR01671 family)
MLGACAAFSHTKKTTLKTIKIMNRETEFRGKVYHYGKDCGWVYGDFYRYYDGSLHYTIVTLEETGSKEYAVEISTVGQWSGLNDKNGTKIFEGDIVQTPCGHSSVEFSHGVFGLNHDFLNPEKQTMLGSWGQKHNLRSLDDGYCREIVVTGNLYDTPKP